MSVKKPAKPSPKASTSKPKAKPAVKQSAKPAIKTVTAAKKVTPPAKPDTKPKTQPVPVALRPHSKQSQLLNLLRSSGATIPQMSELTGWQAHTIRATLSAVFRKKMGLTIESVPVEGSGFGLYRITGKAA